MLSPEVKECHIYSVTLFSRCVYSPPAATVRNDTSVESWKFYSAECWPECWCVTVSAWTFARRFILCTMLVFYIGSFLSAWTRAWYRLPFVPWCLYLKVILFSDYNTGRCVRPVTCKETLLNTTFQTGTCRTWYKFTTIQLTNKYTK